MVSDELKKRKQELGLTTERLSILSGVPIGTINKILNGETKSPRYDTLSALKRILYENITFQPDMISETTTAYHAKRQGEYTIEDYYALPDDVRAELIDGMLIFMEAPSFNHQDISMALTFEFELYIRSNKGQCKVLAAPLDVQLDRDDKTMVQPDIVITCSKDQRTKKGIWGAPDMCIEILSDSTRKRDLSLKLSKYLEAGVREYWIVDPKNEKVICYYFASEDYPILYTFDDVVPVKIYDEKLKIDFSAIKERLES